MEELTGSTVQVVLGIKEGKGFDQILQPTSIIAILNSHSLETDVIEFNANPQYATDLVWESDKNTLRKMRSSQTPLRVECFAIKDNGIREKIGYILLSLRSAQVIPKSKVISPKAVWHKLLGVKNDLKLHKPELLLTLTIEDRESVQQNTTKQKRHEITAHVNASGDFGKNTCAATCMINCLNKQKTLDRHSLSCEALRTQPPTNTVYSHSTDTMVCPFTKMDYSKSVEAYHCYCLNIVLSGIRLSSHRPMIRNIKFQFHHPKAEIMSTVYPKVPILAEEKVKLQDIKCKLHFISAADEIKHLLQSFPPKISIFDAGADFREHISCVILDVKPLFYQNKLECQYEIPLYDAQQNNVGVLDVMLYLENHGPYYRTTKKSLADTLGPPILDDSLAYKIVDELETWKERQKEIFRVELKRKEERHLNLLSEEWQKQKENLEAKLACSVEQCKMLANSLNNATEDLKTRRLKSLEKETRLIKANEDLQWRYETKLQEMKESFHAMQEDLSSKINILQEKKASLEAQIDPLKHENEKLREMVTKLSEELEMYRKASLTQDQTASLLQEVKSLEEKLTIAQRSKTFFKEQWGKAVREIHRIRIEHQQAIEDQIKNSKEELKNFNLEEILSADSTALTNDQILLRQIQKEIDGIKPKSSFIQQEPSDQIFTPTSNVYLYPSQDTNISAKSEQYNERLHSLIEERNALLKTGSYTNDDAIIVKLNAEIRSQLMHS